MKNDGVRGLNPKARSIIDKIAPEDEKTEDVEYIIPGSPEEKQGIEEAILTKKAMIMSTTTVNLVVLIVGIFVPKRISFILGLVSVYVAELFYIHSLDKSLKASLDTDSESSRKIMRRDAVIRLLVLALMGIGSSALFGEMAPIGALAGLLTFKIAIYITPVMLGFIKKHNM